MTTKKWARECLNLILEVESAHAIILLGMLFFFLQARECLAEEPEHLAQIVELWLGQTKFKVHLFF